MSANLSCICDFWSQEIGVFRLPLSISNLNGLGSCEKIPLTNITDIEELGNHPIVWYVPNERGEDGHDVPESPHYTVKTRIEDFIDGRHIDGNYQDRINQLRCKISSMEDGLTQNVVICVAYDTTYKKSLIVDGVKRSLALYYFMVQKQNILGKLLSSNYEIYILRFSSPCTHKIFYGDFPKLIE